MIELSPSARKFQHMALTGYRLSAFPPTGIFGIEIVGENANVLRIASAVEVGVRCIADGVFVPSSVFTS
jgi:hypothetical protein